MTAGFIFISHASKDDAFVKELRLALENLGLPVWVDSRRLRGGDKLAPEIDQAFIRRNTLHSCALRLLAERNGRIKVHPIIDWTDRDVYRYLTLHKLPYHPLWHQGYVSIGDVHTTRRLADGMTEEETRFFGLKRECGLHEYV